MTDDKMKKYVCDACGYEYDPAVGDPDSGIKPGTPFEDLPTIGCVDLRFGQGNFPGLGPTGTTWQHEP